MITRRGFSSSAEAREPTVSRNGRVKKVNSRQDQVDDKAIENADEADSGSQQPVDPVAPVSDQIEERNFDQVNDSSNRYQMQIQTMF